MKRKHCERVNFERQKEGQHHGSDLRSILLEHNLLNEHHAVMKNT